MIYKKSREILKKSEKYFQSAKFNIVKCQMALLGLAGKRTIMCYLNISREINVSIK